MTWETIDDFGCDLIDSRDIIKRLDELEDREDDEDDALDEAEAEELDKLRDFANEAAGYAPDWRYGETLILDSYFEEYAQQLAEDIGAISSDAGWPLSYIDWEAAADALKQDYTMVSIDGHDYWIR